MQFITTGSTNVAYTQQFPPTFVSIIQITIDLISLSDVQYMNIIACPGNEVPTSPSMTTQRQPICIQVDTNSNQYTQSQTVPIEYGVMIVDLTAMTLTFEFQTSITLKQIACMTMDGSALEVQVYSDSNVLLDFNPVSSFVMNFNPVSSFVIKI